MNLGVTDSPRQAKGNVPVIASGAIVGAALMVLFETLYFASLRPSYSHMSNTISELGETGALRANLVGFGFFLPVGLLVWLALWMVSRNAMEGGASVALIALSSIGFGYVVAAFFPCDAGGPLFGTWRTQVHNVAGFIDYEGSGIGFLLVARHFVKHRAGRLAVLFSVAGVLLLFSTALLSLESGLFMRGAVQRIAEVIQFGGLFLVCRSLSQK